jgi:hypothetical protein
MNSSSCSAGIRATSRKNVSTERLLQMPFRRDMVVHAPRGALLWQFREVALLGRATRVAGVSQPEWTRS